MVQMGFQHNGYSHTHNWLTICSNDPEETRTTKNYIYHKLNLKVEGVINFIKFFFIYSSKIYYRIFTQLYWFYRKSCNLLSSFFS